MHSTRVGPPNGPAHPRRAESRYTGAREHGARAIGPRASGAAGCYTARMRHARPHRSRERWPAAPPAERRDGDHLRALNMAAPATRGETSTAVDPHRVSNECGMSHSPLMQRRRAAVRQQPVAAQFVADMTRTAPMAVAARCSWSSLPRPRSECPSVPGWWKLAAAVEAATRLDEHRDVETTPMPNDPSLSSPSV